MVKTIYGSEISLWKKSYYFASWYSLVYDSTEWHLVELHQGLGFAVV